MGILFVGVFYQAMVYAPLGTPDSVRWITLLIHWTFVFFLVVVAFIDVDHKLILDKVTYIAIPVFFALGVVHGGSPFRGAVGIIVGYGIIWVVAEVYFRLTGRHGLGLGDGKLLAAIGALEGWEAVFVSLFGGSVIGSLIGIPLLLLKRKRAPALAKSPAENSVESSVRFAELPFGPFLVTAALVYVFCESWFQLRVFHGLF